MIAPYCEDEYSDKPETAPEPKPSFSGSCGVTTRSKHVTSGLKKINDYFSRSSAHRLARQKQRKHSEIRRCRQESGGSDKTFGNFSEDGRIIYPKLTKLSEGMLWLHHLEKRVELINQSTQRCPFLRLGDWNTCLCLAPPCWSKSTIVTPLIPMTVQIERLTLLPMLQVRWRRTRLQI